MQLSFDDIERIIDRKMPATAYDDSKPWWTNNPANHSQAKAWLNAGFVVVHVDHAGKHVVFQRMKVTGMAEEPRKFEPAAHEPKARHPAIGAMKGLIWIAPGYDLTQPTWDDEDEKAFDAKWDRLLK
ncbi:MAG TPA: hypothetical protein VMU01_06475 [Rhizomicrobium sp.]|nr:hypothetical protein [Rhizomicrobium sp.]